MSDLSIGDTVYVFSGGQELLFRKVLVSDVYEYNSLVYGLSDDGGPTEVKVYFLNGQVIQSSRVYEDLDAAKVELRRRRSVALLSLAKKIDEIESIFNQALNRYD